MNQFGGVGRIVVIALLMLTVATLAAVGAVKVARTQGITFTALKLMTAMHGANFTDSKGNHQLPYRLYRPEELDQSLPLIVVLQSAYGRGDNNLGQLDKTVETLVSIAKSEPYQAYVLAPQCPRGLEWNDSPPVSPPYVNFEMQSLATSWRMKTLVEMIKEVSEEHNVDRSRIYVVGASMGATGAWSFLYRYPRLFSGALIMNGRSDPGVASYIETPVYVVHGRGDNIAPATNSIHMTDALKSNEKQVQLKLVDGGHYIVHQSLSHESLNWLFSRRHSTVERQFATNPDVPDQ